MNVIAVEPRTHNVIIKKSYNTHENAKDSKEMIKDLKKLPDGTVIVAAIKQDGFEALHKGAIKFFSK
jgi:hypothetical protein